MIILIPCIKTIQSNGKKKKGYCLRIAPITPLTFDKLCEEVGRRTTYSPNEVGAVLGEVRDVVIENAEIGRGVDCGPLGYIGPSITSSSADSDDALTLKNVQTLKMVYKPSLAIKHALRRFRMHIERPHTAKTTSTSENE